MRFKSWSEKGIWEYLFQQLQNVVDTEYTIIDATIIRAHACSAGYKKDSSDQEALGGARAVLQQRFMLWLMRLEILLSLY